MDQMNFQMPGNGPPMMNQPPQIFGSYGPDGIPNMSHISDMTAHMFSDAQLLLDDSNDAKRRRIARVCNRATSVSQQHGKIDRPANSPLPRPATCAGKRKSSATASCPPAQTAPPTRPTAPLLRSKRSAPLPRGEPASHHCPLSGPTSTKLTLRSAKYIEGLENRLGRMEQLLRLSGTLRPHRTTRHV